MKLILAALAEEGVELIRPLTNKQNLEIRCALLSVRIIADAGRVSQVITNLLANAVRYNRPDGRIDVTTRRKNDCAVLTVADIGQGIATADLPHVFERFYRGDKRSSTHGSGLGLAICKSIVEGHGGSIEIWSQENQGTSVTVCL